MRSKTRSIPRSRISVHLDSDVSLESSFVRISEVLAPIAAIPGGAPPPIDSIAIAPAIVVGSGGGVAGMSGGIPGIPPPGAPGGIPGIPGGIPGAPGGIPGPPAPGIGIPS